MKSQIYLTTTELASRLSVDPHTVAVWRLRGTGPGFFKLGRVIRYSIEDVEAWLAKQRFASP